MVLETDDEFFHIFALKTNLIHGDKQGEPVNTHTHTFDRWSVKRLNDMMANLTQTETIQQKLKPSKQIWRKSETNTLFHVYYINIIGVSTAVEDAFTSLSFSP